MRYLNPSDIRQALSYEEMMAAVEEAFLLFAQGRCAMADRSALTQGSTTLATMPCFAGGYAATKLLASCPDNPRRGLPSLYGTVLLSQGDTGQPVALLEGNTLTALRTGAIGGLAAKHLARKGAKTLGVLGCGAQGRCAVRSFDEHFDLERIIVYSATPDKLERYVRETEGTLRARLEIAQSPRDLAECSDILLTATTCRTPLIRAEWLPEGCLVDAMFAFNDIEPQISRFCDKWVVGHRESDRIEILEHPSFGHLLDPSDVYASLGEIVCGKVPGRENDRERIVFSHMGMGTLDIAVGVHLVEKARRLGAGRTLRLT